MSFRVRPFVYKKIAEFAKELNKEVSLSGYLVWGGFPKKIEFESEEAIRRYLDDLDETIVVNDLINRYDITHNFENIVYNELIYMGYDISVFNNKGKEIDFLAQKGNKKYYIKVTYSIAEEKTYNREFLAFDNLDNSAKKIIITNDDIDYSTSMVEHIKFKDFVLMESLEKK